MTHVIKPTTNFYAYLFRQIDALPKVLQDLIHEYNVDHRPEMNRVCKELLFAYQHRFFRFTFDYHRCDGYDCEKRYRQNKGRNPYIIKKCVGRYHVFCSSRCEYDVLHDLRRSNRHIPKGYARQMKRYLCFLPKCHCSNCVEYTQFEKERREGNLNEFDEDEDFYEDEEIDEDEEDYPE